MDTWTVGDAMTRERHLSDAELLLVVDDDLATDDAVVRLREIFETLRGIQVRMPVNRPDAFTSEACLQHRACAIGDLALRRSFLSNVSEHARTLGRAREWAGAP